MIIIQKYGKVHGNTIDVEAIAKFQSDIASSKLKQKYCATGSEDTKS